MDKIEKINKRYSILTTRNYKYLLEFKNDNEILIIKPLGESK